MRRRWYGWPCGDIGYLVGIGYVDVRYHHHEDVLEASITPAGVRGLGIERQYHIVPLAYAGQ